MWFVHIAPRSQGDLQLRRPVLVPHVRKLWCARPPAPGQCPARTHFRASPCSQTLPWTDFRYDLAKSLRPRRSVKMAMQHECTMYAIAQKEGLGMVRPLPSHPPPTVCNFPHLSLLQSPIHHCSQDKAVEEAKYRMSRYGVTPNMMVIPPCATLDSNPRPRPCPRCVVASDPAPPPSTQQAAGPLPHPRA